MTLLKGLKVGRLKVEGWKIQSSLLTFSLVQEGRSQEAEGTREESLYSKVFNLFSVVGYFCRAALVTC
jgi:hypothetical protein